MTTGKTPSKEQMNRTLARLQAAYKKNRAIADKIVKELDRRGAHVFVGTSSEGLSFHPQSARDVSILRDVLKLQPVKVLKSGKSRKRGRE